MFRGVRQVREAAVKLHHAGPRIHLEPGSAHRTQHLGNRVDCRDGRRRQRSLDLPLALPKRGGRDPLLLETRDTLLKDRNASAKPDLPPRIAKVVKLTGRIRRDVLLKVVANHRASVLKTSAKVPLLGDDLGDHLCRVAPSSGTVRLKGVPRHAATTQTLRSNLGRLLRGNQRRSLADSAHTRPRQGIGGDGEGKTSRHVAPGVRIPALVLGKLPPQVDGVLRLLPANPRRGSQRLAHRFPRPLLRVVGDERRQKEALRSLQHVEDARQHSRVAHRVVPGGTGDLSVYLCSLGSHQARNGVYSPSCGHLGGLLGNLAVPRLRGVQGLVLGPRRHCANQGRLALGNGDAGIGAKLLP